MSGSNRGSRIAIRRASRDDAAALTAIALAAKSTWDYPAAWIEAWVGELTFTPDYVAAHYVFAADVEGTPVGVCALERHDDHWSLAHVWVTPAAQGLGAGRAIVSHALDAARVLAPELVVRIESDPNAVDFYTRLGARMIGVVSAPMPGAPTRALPLLELDLEADRHAG
jgi:GNAT superfamily N-acetyltransferase